VKSEYNLTYLYATFISSLLNLSKVFHFWNLYERRKKWN